jgi:hypothetical protein
MDTVDERAEQSFPRLKGDARPEIRQASPDIGKRLPQRLWDRAGLGLLRRRLGQLRPGLFDIRQRVLPFLLQRSCNQAVLRIDTIVLPFGTLGGILLTRDLLPEMVYALAVMRGLPSGSFRVMRRATRLSISVGV